MYTKAHIRWVASGLLAAALAGAGAGAGAAAAASGDTTVAGNVAGWVKSASKGGAASLSTTAMIAVHMTLRNASGLKQLATEVSSPKSAHYGHYLTSQELEARFAPSAADVNAVKALLEHAGMTDVTIGAHGAYVSAKATVSQIAKTFKVTQNLYSYKGLTLRANAEAPSIPASLAGKVLFIEGLDDSGMLRTPFHRSAYQGALVAPSAKSESSRNAAIIPPPVAAVNPAPYCNTDFGSSELVVTLSTSADVYGAEIPWLVCGYTPQQIRAAYGLEKTKYNGTGITVAITDAFANPTLLSDANRYAVNHALPKLVPGKNFNEIIPAGIYDVRPSNSCGPYGWFTEQSLDIDAVHGAAPGANILFVGSEDCYTSLDLAWANVLYNHLADVVTDSWGYGGEVIAPGQQAADDQAAMAGAAQGVTVLFGSGDDGDLAEDNGVGSDSWPATSAWVTGVGGTSLFITDSKSGAKSEYGWGNYRAFLTDVTVNSATSVTDSGVEQTTAFGYTFDNYVFYAGSGGGISLLESQPFYQAAAVPEYLATSLNLASGYTETLPNPMRVSPDVAMDADPYTGYLYGMTYTIAGNAIADYGCTPISTTEEYCEQAIGGTSLASPLMAGVMAVVNQKRLANGEPTAGFANPLLYSLGSRGDGVNLRSAPINQIIAPTAPVSVFRGYAANLHEARVVTINSVPFLIITAPYALEVCGAPICLGVDDIFNYTSESAVVSSPPGYNDVTGLGVPWVPQLLHEE